MHNRVQNHFRDRRAEAPSPPATAVGDDYPAALPAGEPIARRAARTLEAHPAIAIGAAFAVGILIGKWVKR